MVFCGLILTGDIMINSAFNTVFLPYPDKDDRQVWIYVPQHQENIKLPVVYMTDGQNLFENIPTEFGCWNVISTVEKEQQNGSSGAVIVGIDNGNEFRDNELTPKSIGKVIGDNLMNNYSAPEGDIFDSFLMNTVIPYVEQNYPVKTERENVSICGSSSGGLQAFFSGIEHSEKFAFVGALSPAFLLYDRADWQKYLLSKIKAQMPYLYIYTGNGDELEQLIFESVEMMYDLLPEIDYPYDMMNEVILFENGHNEKAWCEIFKDFLHTALNLK